MPQSKEKDVPQSQKVDLHKALLRKHCQGGRYSHYDGTRWDLLLLIMEFFYDEQYRQKGAYPGTCILTLPPEAAKDFFVKRLQGGERKSPARVVSLICWNRQALKERSGGPTTEADWEVVSINAN